MNKKLLIIKYYFNYLILLLIFKYSYIILPVKFNDFNGFYALIYIPIAYLVVKYMFIYDLEKNKYLKKQFIYPILFGYTILNFILRMPLLYTIFIIIFLIIINGELVVNSEESNKYIDEYYKTKHK